MIISGDTGMWRATSRAIARKCTRPPLPLVAQPFRLSPKGAESAEVVAINSLMKFELLYRSKEASLPDASNDDAYKGNELIVISPTAPRLSNTSQRRGVD